MAQIVSEVVERGYASPFWMTYKQAQALGGQVRKRERSAQLVYAGAIERIEKTDSGEESERRIPFLKAYAVFCADQIDGLPDQIYPRSAPAAPMNENDRLPRVDAFFAHTGADIREGGSRAFYRIDRDYVQMPPFASFSAKDHAATLAHECIHWTRHTSRLDRDFGRKVAGDEGYAREKLVAEIGGAFLAADLCISIEPREDHAAYIASWLTVLQNDKRAIFQAVSYAERAVAFLHGLQPGRGQADPEADDADLADMRQAA